MARLGRKRIGPPTGTTATARSIGGRFQFDHTGPGTHSITAAYEGDTNNAPSTSAAVEQQISTPPTVSKWQYGYDAIGRVHTMIDPNGLTTYIYYDKLGRPIQAQQPPNTGTASPTVIQFGYDAADNLTRVVDPRALTTTYTVSGLGSVKQQDSPDSGVTQYTSFNGVGKPLTSVDARGKTTQYGYDVMHRLTSMVVLQLIATLKLPFRPGRIEPRAKKRRPKNLPVLMEPRDQARAAIRLRRGLS